MAAPQFLSPDGFLRVNLAFSTTLESRFLSGEIDDVATSVEVSIRGGEFTSDPDLIVFDSGSFLIPNPAAFPDGLDLVTGSNVIKVRSMSLSGESPISTADVRFVEEFTIPQNRPPSGMSVEQLRHEVRVVATAPRRFNPLTPDSDIVGFNFYSSETQGGSTTGYTRINLFPISEAIPSRETNRFGFLRTEFPKASNDIGLRVHTVITQELDGVVIQIPVNAQTGVPTDAQETLQATVILEVVDDRFLYVFTHGRSNDANSNPSTIFNGNFSALPEEDPLYYVATVVYFDTDQNLEFESSFSEEVVGKPTVISEQVGSFPLVSRETILQSTVLSIFRTDPGISIQPGSVLRDTVLDPFTAEAERLRFIVDFLYRASSFSTLLVIDDPDGTGSSIAVSDSSYKQALGQSLFMTSDNAVQNVLDRAFEKLASNFGEVRELGVRSRGEFTFFTRTQPRRTFNIPLGTQVVTPGGTFRTLTAARLPFENSAAFYDAINGRYAIRVAVEAIVPGVQGDIARGQVNTTAAGLNVTNEAKTFGGQERDNNLQLATRALNRLSSVDTGTEQGYHQTAVSVPGVIKANVIAAGDPLMQRDYDPDDKIHRGGKVDIWIQGDSEAELSDTFAFTFEIARDIQFVPIGDLSALEFRALDVTLNTLNPLVEMLDFVDLDLGLQNISTGFDFDLTGVTVTGFDTIKLDTGIPQPAIDLTDVVLGDYRYRTGEKFVFSRQPVSAVVSLTGAVSGVISTDNFTLIRPEPLLAKGRSTQAGDYLQVTEGLTGTGTFGDPIQITDEQHVVVADNPEFVNFLGANSLSVVVFNEDRSVEFKGPFDPSGDPDYTIIEGTQISPLGIQRIEGGDLLSGTTISVDYQHDENFTVRYDTNLVVSAVQDTLDTMRHLTADVLAKEALSSPVNITATIILERGASSSTTDIAVRRALTNFLNRMRTDNPLRQSDVVGIIEGVSGVSHVLTPLTRLVRGEGSVIVREELLTGQIGDTTLVNGWSTPTVLVWLIRESLLAATTTGGGPVGEFRGVFQDDDELELQIVNPELLGTGSDRAFIIGSEGLVIPGVSDDATLIADGFSTSARIAEERLNRTANRVLISLGVGISPSSDSYSVTYVVGQDTGAKDLNPGPAEFLTSGLFTFTYDEARENSLRRIGS